MPSLSSLRTHLSQFLEVTSAAEVVLFERTTFLVISSVTAPQAGSSAKIEDVKKGEESKEVEGADEWDKRRFERISTMVKAFKLGCSYVIVVLPSLFTVLPVGRRSLFGTKSDFALFVSKIRAPFMSLTVCTANYTAVLDALTAETYILVISRGNVRESSFSFDVARPSPLVDRQYASVRSRRLT